jgi:2-oxoglutarate dehydrogenase E2 component (dihydrolipoamide succinyltransferase)
MTALVDVSAPADNAEGTRSQVLRWLKSPGEHVVEHEPLIELETDKVTVEIPAPATGVLREIFKHEQDEVAPGDRLGSIDVGTGQVAAAGVAASGPAPDSGSRATPPAPATGNRGAPASHRAASDLSPAVRRLLVEDRIDAGELVGSGAGGRITADDVLRAVAARSTVARADRAPVDPAAATGEQTVNRRVPHSAMRKRIAARMVESLLHTAPHVTTVFDADLGAVLAHRERHRADFAARGAPLTLTAYFVAACVDAIHAVPETNARWTDDALEYYDRIDIGIGTALPDKGLVVPVIRNVAALDLGAIARALGDLTARARADRLTPADVRGGTFTISNHGVSGSLLAAPIVINQPQSAILGVGRVEKRPIVVTEDGVDRVVVRPRCYVTLTIDHRVMDGHRANRFLEVLIGRLSNWTG